MKALVLRETHLPIAISQLAMASIGNQTELLEAVWHPCDCQH